MHVAFKWGSNTEEFPGRMDMSLSEDAEDCPELPALQMLAMRRMERKLFKKKRDSVPLEGVDQAQSGSCTGLALCW